MSPAGIYEHDSMFSVRQTPWHGLGVILDKHPRNIDDAIKKAQLDWEVEQRPVLIPAFAGLNLDDDGESEVDLDVIPVDGYYANVREDTGQTLGIVTERYQPVSNKEAFSFLASIFGSEMLFETAGSLMNGRRVWVMMKIPDFVEVGGDPIARYAFISNSHDGKSAVLLACTGVRIVCENTLLAALRGVQRTYTIRHLGNPSQKIAEARNALQVTINYYEQFKEAGDKLALAKLTDNSVRMLTEKLIPTEEGMGDRAAKNREEARQAIMHIYKEGTIVDGLSTRPENAPDTAWAFYNAATEWADWYRGERKAGGRFQRAIDDPDGFKNHAWKLAMEAAA